MSLQKLVVDTDLVCDYLTHRQQRPPKLRVLMMHFFCYTTVFNAIELFSLARTARERRAVEDSLRTMKILGLNAKHAKRYGEWFARVPHVPEMQKLIAGLCLESHMPLATGDTSRYTGIRGLRVLPASSIREGVTASQMWKGVRRLSR